MERAPRLRQGHEVPGEPLGWRVAAQLHAGAWLGPGGEARAEAHDGAGLALVQRVVVGRARRIQPRPGPDAALLTARRFPRDGGPGRVRKEELEELLRGRRHAHALLEVVHHDGHLRGGQVAGLLAVSKVKDL